MILDERTEFCDAGTELSAATLPSAIGDVIDLGEYSDNESSALTRDIAAGRQVWLIVIVTTAITNTAGTETLTLTLRSHEAADLETGGTPTDHLTWSKQLATTAVAGAQAGDVIFKQTLPLGDYQRYLGIYGSITGSDVNAGAINAFLTDNPDAWQALQEAPNAQTPA